MILLGVFWPSDISHKDQEESNSQETLETAQDCVSALSYSDSVRTDHHIRHADLWPNGVRRDGSHHLRQPSARWHLHQHNRWVVPSITKTTYLHTTNLEVCSMGFVHSMQTFCTYWVCIFTTFAKMCSIEQSTLRGILYPTMQCTWVNLPFPVRQKFFIICSNCKGWGIITYKHESTCLITGCPLYTGWVKTANQIKALPERLRFFVCNLHQRVIDWSVGGLWSCHVRLRLSPSLKPRTGLFLARFWLETKGCYF